MPLTCDRKPNTTVVGSCPYIHLTCFRHLHMARDFTDQFVISIWVLPPPFMGCHGHDGMVVGFTTTYAISAYHH